jgi:hypothetical protein
MLPGPLRLLFLTILVTNGRRVIKIAVLRMPPKRLELRLHLLMMRNTLRMFLYLGQKE